MSRRTSAGLNAVYNGGLAQGYIQGGAGLMDWLKKANNFAKENQLISKAASVASALGADKYLDEKTGGLFSKGVEMAKQQGYGKRRRMGGRKKGGAKKKGGARRK